MLLEELESEALSAIEEARLYFPYEDDNELDWIIWSKTGFPAFWHNGTPIQCFRRQLRQYRQAVYNNPNAEGFCDMCDKPAVKEHGFMQCWDCGYDWDLRISKFPELSEKSWENPEAYKELCYYLHKRLPHE